MKKTKKEIRPIRIEENKQWGCQYKVFKNWQHYMAYNRYHGFNTENIVKGPFFSNH